MNKNLVPSLVLLIAVLSAPLVYASGPSVIHGYNFQEQNPANARMTIVLSGACSAKIDVPITKVQYGLNYVADTVNNKIKENSVYVFLTFDSANPDIYAHAQNNLQSAGEKATESINNGKHSLMFNFVGNGYLNTTAVFKGIAMGGYDSQIKCKDDKTLQQMMLPGWEASFEGHGEKSGGSLVHDEVNEGQNGHYKAKLSSSGTLKVPSQCTIQGGWEDSFQYKTDKGRVVCTPANSIKVKINISAQGNSEWYSI